MNNQTHLDDLVKIRTLMERSTRFLSLSGLSGVFAGIYALSGAYLVHSYLKSETFITSYHRLIEPINISGVLVHYSFFMLVAGGVLFLSLVTGVLFSFRKASKSGEKFWNVSSKRLAINLIIPLISGAIFCLQLLNYGLPGFVAPAMLIFYGLALINGSKYTLDDIRHLGILEVILGICSLFMIGYGLYFWAIGFGLLHIIYGVVVYYKYDS